MLLHGLLFFSQAMLLTRARHEELRNAYPWFWLWVLFALVRTGALFPLDPLHSSLYPTLWSLSRWFSIPLQFMVVWEWSHTLGTHFVGRGRIANGILVGTCVLAVVVSILTVQDGELGWRSNEPEVQQWTEALVAQRFFGTAFALSMVLIAGFYRFFGDTDIPIRENLKVQQNFLIAVWTLQAVGYWVIYATGARARPLVNVVLGIAGPVLLVAWAIALRPQGEIVPALAAPTEAMKQSVARLEEFIERSRDPR